MTKSHVRVLMVIAAVTLVTPAVSYAASCEDGIKHYVAGEYKDAVAVWDSLLKEGDACAEYWLGESYNLGQGIQKNPDLALKLFESSASKGYDKAVAKVWILKGSK